VAFSEDVDRRAGVMPVTYVGHSYGGSILGTAERFGLTADRVVYVEAAGAGVGVRNPSDWHNRNPAVLRFAITAPGDPIGLVQGIPFGSHGADPDEMPGVIGLAAGRRLTGGPMAGLSAHSDVLTEPSDAWRNILAVITGDREHIRLK
jgi:pimeloyl-ACP methyl ester carboxylesterase